jgi:hypothetical protein
MAEGTAGSGESGVAGTSGDGAPQKPKRVRKPQLRSSQDKAQNAAIVKVSEGKKSLATLPFKGSLTYAISLIPGGKATFIEYARLSPDPKIKEAVHRWDTLSLNQKKRMTVDMLCAAVEIPPVDMLKEVTGIAYQYNIDLSNFIAAVHQPQVVDRTIKSALRKDGVDDRRMMHQHSGFIPSPRGPQVTISNNVSAQAAAAAKNTVQGDDSGLPDFELDAVKTVQSLRGDDSE